jgi:hypothetical protein
LLCSFLDDLLVIIVLQKQLQDWAAHLLGNLNGTARETLGATDKSCAGFPSGRESRAFSCCCACGGLWPLLLPCCASPETSLRCESLLGYRNRELERFVDSNSLLRVICPADP